MIKNALKTLRTILPEQTVTPEQIKIAVNEVLKMSFYEHIDRELLLKEAEDIYYNIKIKDIKIIEGIDRNRPWLLNRKAEIKWRFWNRYRDFLKNEENYPVNIIQKLNTSTDQILDRLFDPKLDVSISKRGLIVGHVQSGKTSNYTGLICKAADAGFNVIVVLAGMHNNLRSQTQLRLDEGFLGFDTYFERVSKNRNELVGVGKIPVNPDHPPLIAHSITSNDEAGDFRKNSVGINFLTPDTILAVVKKNTSVLKKLTGWIEFQSQYVNGKQVIRDKTLLLVDDEADNASINTKKEDISAINKHIRNILELFEKSAYIGYTATPFANVFIPTEEQKDIFPRDFIISLPTPSNYIGPEKIFGINSDKEEETNTQTLPIVCKITDHIGLFTIKKQDKKTKEYIDIPHKIDSDLPEELPASLKLAIKCFIITCTIRYVRGQKNEHNSMLVHVSRYTKWQSKVYELVNSVFSNYSELIEFQDPSFKEELRQVFEGEIPGFKNYVQASEEILDSTYGKLDSQIQIHQWSEIEKHLLKATSKIVVKQINGSSKDILNYYDNKDNGISIIAIGGDKLSRGLTLYGLSISYFLRTSKMYDTLMQMGRWFGYRKGYVDLCRLFTTGQINEWFCHITKASEELRREFNYMSDILGSTPENYALKVKTHPGVLQITASNKLRSAVPLKFSFSGRLVETYTFDKDEEVLKSNFLHTRFFIKSLGEVSLKRSNAFIWKDVTPEIVKEFFNAYQNASNLRRANTGFIINYINRVLNYGELTNWSVALISKSDAEKVVEYEINGNILSIGQVKRKQAASKGKVNIYDANVYYLNHSRLSSPRHEYIDLDASKVNKRLFEERKKTDKADLNYLSGEIIRNELRSPQNPLLLIYSLNASESGMEAVMNDIPIIGFAISFPKSSQPEQIINIDYKIQENLLPYLDTERDIEEYYEHED